uniref:Uncharacterized protein n=1 Tax=Arundo donax TaxID=35708 RepID=A0A0A9B9C5_ARUDO
MDKVGNRDCKINGGGRCHCYGEDGMRGTVTPFDGVEEGEGSSPVSSGRDNSDAIVVLGIVVYERADPMNATVQQLSIWLNKKIPQILYNLFMQRIRKKNSHKSTWKTPLVMTRI